MSEREKKGVVQIFFCDRPMDYLREVSGIWPPLSHRGCNRRFLPPPHLNIA